MTLTEKIEYKKVIWIFGFVKTTLSSALISTGVVLVFNGITNHPLFHEWNEIAIISGCGAIIIAIMIIVSIDKWREIKKKDELECIEKDTTDKINKFAKAVAEEKVLEYLKEIENEE